jgi:hypothetical protein
MVLAGINRKCRDSIAGVSEIYLFKYYDYSRSQIIIEDNFLVTFPTTKIYKFEVTPDSTANEQQEQNEGGKFFNQSIGLSFRSSELLEIEKLIDLDYRIIFRDRNGLYRIFGLYNGMQGGAIGYNTGSGKSDFNGLKIDFNGLEEKQSFFIANLQDAGFELDNAFLLQENGDYLLQENLFKIIL